MKESEIIEAFCRLEIENLSEIFGVSDAFDHVLKLVEVDLDWRAYFLRLENEEREVLLNYLKTGVKQDESEFMKALKRVGEKVAQKP